MTEASGTSALFGANQIASLEMRDFIRSYISTGSPLLDMVIGMAVFRLILYITSLAETPWCIPEWLMFWKATQHIDIHKSQFEFEFIDDDDGVSRPHGDFFSGYTGVIYQMSQIQDDRVWKLR